MTDVIRHGRQEPLLPGRNEAAERLRERLDEGTASDSGSHLHYMLDAALAEERRATVERIRAAFLRTTQTDTDLHAILDAEAQP